MKSFTRQINLPQRPLFGRITCAQINTSLTSQSSVSISHVLRQAVLRKLSFKKRSSQLSALSTEGHHFYFTTTTTTSLLGSMPLTTRRTTSSNSLIDFYLTTGKDPRGRALSDILAWDAHRLEASHDYIQILFPLPEESGVNWNAPVVNKEVYEAFKGSEELKGNLRRSFERLAWFYGFDVVKGDNGEIQLSQAANYSTHSQNWNIRFDHNHLRITRIIRSLRVLGLEKEALAFYHALENVSPLNVSKRSREYWRRAAERSLNIRPDAEVMDEQDDSIGHKWLRDTRTEERLEKTAQEEMGAEEKNRDDEALGTSETLTESK